MVRDNTVDRRDNTVDAATTTSSVAGANLRPLYIYARLLLLPVDLSS